MGEDFSTHVSNLPFSLFHDITLSFSCKTSTHTNVGDCLTVRVACAKSTSDPMLTFEINGQHYSLF